MKGEKLWIEVSSPRPFRNDEYSASVIYWAIISNSNNSNGKAAQVHPKFKMGYVLFKFWELTKYDNHLMYENYSQPKTDSLEIARMTSFRQNYPNLFLIYTVHIINFLQYDKENKLTKSSRSFVTQACYIHVMFIIVCSWYHSSVTKAQAIQKQLLGMTSTHNYRNYIGTQISQTVHFPNCFSISTAAFRQLLGRVVWVGFE